MDKLLFKTARYRCRYWKETDLEQIFTVYSDAETVRLVGDGNPLSYADCVKWLDVTSNNYIRRGYGMFAVEEIASGNVIGFCGLVHPGNQPEPEVKYAFNKTCWGQGVATEVISALLPYGSKEWQLQRIIATVYPENIASQRVLEKAGAILAEQLFDDGVPILLYVWGNNSVSV